MESSDSVRLAQTTRSVISARTSMPRAAAFPRLAAGRTRIRQPLPLLAGSGREPASPAGSRRGPNLRTLLAAAVAAAFLAAAGPALAASADEGKAIFEGSCASCHTLGGGDLVGPDLAGVLDRRELDWVTRFILSPDSLIASGDPIATELVKKYGVPMPNLGLTQAQVDSLIAYLQAAGGGGATTQPATTAPAQTAPAATAPAETTPAATAPAQTTPATAGDPAIGKDLFTGATAFENGGAPCMSCHTIAGIGSLGGGKLGPDLTPAFAKYNGEAGLSAVLKQIAFPTMVPVFANHPLTDQEVANLTAFIADAPPAARPGWAAGKLVLLALGGIAALAAVALLAWRRRLVSVRRLLVRGATNARR